MDLLAAGASSRSCLNVFAPSSLCFSQRSTLQGFSSLRRVNSLKLGMGDIPSQIFLNKASTRDPEGAVVGGLVDLIAVVEGRRICLELVVPLSSVSRAFGAHDKAQGRHLEEFLRRLVRLKNGNHRVGHRESVVLEVAEHFDSSVLLHQPEDLATLSQRLYTRMQAQVHRATLDWPD